MNDSSSPPARKDANLLYVGVAAVMLIAAAVMVWLKTAKSQTPQSETSMVPSAYRPPPRRRAGPAPPPPPTLEDLEDSGATAEVKEASMSRRANVCADPCQGDVGSTLRSQLAMRGQQSQGCYERALRNNPKLAGSLMVALRVSASGTICQASIAADSVGDESVSACVLRRFQTTAYPKPKGGCVDVRVPIKFVPKG